MRPSKSEKSKPSESPPESSETGRPETAEEAARIMMGEVGYSDMTSDLETEALESTGIPRSERKAAPRPAQIGREIVQGMAAVSGASSPASGGTGGGASNPSSPGSHLPAGVSGSPPPSRGGTMSNYILFADMRDSNTAAFQRLVSRYYDLTVQQSLLQGAQLPPGQQAELNNIQTVFAASGLPPSPAPPPTPQTPTPSAPVYDPLYYGIQVFLGSMGQLLLDEQNGVLPSQQGSPPAAALTAPERQMVAIYGLLEADSLTSVFPNGFIPNPSANPSSAGPPIIFQPPLWPQSSSSIPISYSPHWQQNATKALSEYSQSQDLFDAVLAYLIMQASANSAGPAIEVNAEQWVSVVRILAAAGISANDRQLPLRIDTALAQVINAGSSGPPSSIDINLPDLDAQSDLEIVADNIRAMEAIYFAAMLEEVKLFQVADKNVELWQTGVLPFGKSNAGDLLYKYWKSAVNRMQEVERRNLYARTFGLAGGETQVAPNRDFNDQWYRFISAVSSFSRQYTLENLLRTTVPIAVTQEQVRKAGMDLAGNLSLHGYGIAYFAATELQTQINDIIALLSDPDIKTAWSARDIWQVVEQCSTLYLGGAKNTIRYRTMATAGAIIIRWLAERTQLLTGTSIVNLLDLNQVRNPNSPTSPQPMVSPTDRDLLNACDQWLAVTGTQEQSIDQYAQPVDAPSQTSRPIQIPDIAKDMLSSVGISTGLAGNGNYVRR